MFGENFSVYGTSANGPQGTKLDETGSSLSLSLALSSVCFCIFPHVCMIQCVCDPMCECIHFVVWEPGPAMAFAGSASLEAALRIRCLSEWRGSSICFPNGQNQSHGPWQEREPLPTGTSDESRSLRTFTGTSSSLYQAFFFFFFS